MPRPSFSWRLCAAACFLISPAIAHAAPRVALDPERLCLSPVGRFPTDVPTCQALIVGGGLGGSAAAEDLARRGISVILVELTSHLGGQLTTQGVSTPDENRFIDQIPGPGTPHYRALRRQVWDHYAQLSGIQAPRQKNVGQCWVGTTSGEPNVWEAALWDRLKPWMGPSGIRRVLLRHQLVAVQRYPGNGKVSYLDFVNLDTGKIIRIGAQYVLDAGELGDVLNLSGAPWTLGQEAQGAYHEPDAPSQAHPDWIQSFTYSFDVRWNPDAVLPTASKPDEYEYFKSLGEYSLIYKYPEPRGPVPYKVFEKAPGAAGPFWTYRRLVAASSFDRNPQYAQDIALINWSGNDFHLESFIGKAPQEQLRILIRAKAFAQGFLYWLQTECPRDDGGTGYPEMQAAGDVLGGDGFGVLPYIRESRRLLSEYVIRENDMLPTEENPDAAAGTEFFDSVGIGLYAIDIHPSRNEPPLLKSALPYEIPLGAFIARSGPSNVLPASKNIGASRLAAASLRVHPQAWLIGEIAGRLAAFCLEHHVEPHQVRADPALLSAFQSELAADGIPNRWSDVPAFGR
ncbi:FAD-dependent oxidoreductase [Capsulimonas corticalis]|uniref:FAD-dependent oxidoreductase n=1 Tax=Capsulimonas corticalis TaxID=2219043 RepID=A0A402CR80_9BACT|nr:FAD-dependent oxidoreductase [Capsulimonas corticalis]BDI34535.1 FAD-dependent oxidoreductase [Capsulimonas corticalis]